MSFSPDTFRKKLDSLQDTQELIVSISQWVLFHHRHAKDLCQLWSEYARTNVDKMKLNKKLALLYLCNDVVQEARHKRKPEFAAAFAEILPDVLNEMYPKLDSLQPKAERLIGVWEQRNIFDKTQIRNMRRAIELLKLGKPFEAGEPDTPVESGNSQVAGDLVLLNKLYIEYNRLQELCQSNLTQVGFQLKQYLPQQPGVVDNLPLPKVYISKLNVLEKLCNLTTQNLKDIETTRLQIVDVLAGLQRSLGDRISTDDSKAKLIEKRLEKLRSTRAELQEMLEPEEEASPVFESNDSGNDIVPTYESSSDDDSAVEGPTTKKRRLSETSNTSNTSKKSVAFSEDIQIKEYNLDDQTEEIKIVGSDNESEEEYAPAYDDPAPADLAEFEAHHKDDLDLMHEKQHESDGYDPDGGQDQKSGLLSLLSKLN